MDYRSLPRYANSDLGEFRNLLFSIKTPFLSSAATAFGSLFHAFLLEQKLPDEVDARRMSQLTAMRDAVLRNKFASAVLEFAKAEQIQFWNDPQTGLPCKAQTDLLVVDEALLVDIKTTSTRTYAEFLKNCKEYAYDRQAAFYLDGTPHANRFVILGVQKQAAYQIFYFEASACRGCIEGGRKQYQGLLRGILREGFRPSSWNQNTTT